MADLNADPIEVGTGRRSGVPAVPLRPGERGAQNTFLAILVVGVLLALGFVFVVIFVDAPEPAPPVEKRPEPEASNPAPPRPEGMPDRRRAIEELRDERNPPDPVEEPPPGPIPGWTLEESEKSVAEAIDSLTSFHDESDPYDIRIAVQKLAEQKDFAIPAIQNLLADGLDTSFGGGVSILQGSMEKYPSLRIALMEALRRMDSAASHGVLASLLSNADDPKEAGYAVWMLQNTSVKPEVYSQALAASAETLLGSGFAGAESFRDLTSTRWILDAVKSHPVPSAIPGLVRVSRESINALVKREAEQALAASGSREAAEAILENYLSQPTPQQRNEKGRLVGQTHGQAILPSLRELLFDTGKPDQEKSAIVAGISAYNSVVNREDRLRNFRREGRDADYEKERQRYRADLDGRIQLLTEVFEATGKGTPVGTHAEIALRRLKAMRTRLNEMESE